ncbi:MAG TPA: DUF72 domain-containing protein [Sphingomicrobium sp.]|nr:DUF72 domain-containing protein [Sphingomicrobium sp.]
MSAPADRTRRIAVNVGTAGWTIPRQNAEEFPIEGSSLERYAQRLPVVEINSSFHRPHRSSTWERWRDSVPESFRFSVKLPRTITHHAKLVDCSDLLQRFLDQVHLLGDKLGVLLVQLPPKLEFDPQTAASFFAELRSRSPALVACEPRNPSWFSSEVSALLERQHIARVAADPAVSEEAMFPGGWPGLRYWRFHGSPAIYRSSYLECIPQMSGLIELFAEDAYSWCIFDNTASSAALSDALSMARQFKERKWGASPAREPTG